MRSALLILTAAVFAAQAADRITPPAQPAHGPGGADYPHAKVQAAAYGSGGLAFHIFEPADPAPETAPVIVFIHGWTATDPWIYGAWIEHLARRGCIVIHPRYQESVLTPGSRFTGNALRAVQDAFAELAKPGHVRPDRKRFAIAGHSVGGLLTANLGALALTSGLPAPRALMSVQPGRSTRAPGGAGIRLEDLAKIPGTTLLLCVTGEKDRVCGDADARRILAGTTAIPAARKNHVVLVEDLHGLPAITASHLAPCSIPACDCEGPVSSGPVREARVADLLAAARGDFAPLRKFMLTPEGRLWRRERLNHTHFAETFAAPDVQDFVLWRLLDRLCDAAFTGKVTVDALAKSPRSLVMGQWSNGTAIKPMRPGPLTTAVKE